MARYLTNIAEIVANAAAALQGSKEFKAIYKNSLATFVSLNRIGRQRLRLIHSASDSARRVPVLVACRQMLDASAELRRFIELVTWFPYFDDHRVEWRSFENSPWQGYVKYDSNPIAAAAHREISYYFAYILEKAECQTSSPLAKSVAALQAGYSEASKFVHAAVLVHGGAGGDAFDTIEGPVLRQFGNMQRSVFRAGVVVLAWSNSSAVHRLTAVERSWFEWLLGKDISNSARSASLQMG